MPSTTYRPLTGRFSTLDGANCLTVGKRHLSQREAAIEAVDKIGRNQLCDIEKELFLEYREQLKIFGKRKNVLLTKRIP